jgi:signal transduction histidine kinase
MRSLRAKLTIGFGGLLAILVVVSLLSIIVLARYSHALEKMFRDNYDSVLYCNQMRDSLDELHSHAQRLVWHESLPPADSDPHQQTRRFQRNIDLELGNCNLPGELEAAQHLAGVWKDYRDAYLRLGTPGNDDVALLRDFLLPRYQEIKRSAQTIADMNSSNMVSVDGQVRTTLVAVQRTLLILVIVGAVLAASLVATVGATILKPLRALTLSAHQIEKGNLDLDMPVVSRDEVGQLTEAFNSMASRLREFKRQDNARLARTQQTTQLAIDSLPDGVVVVSPQGEVEISNRAAQSLFNIHPGSKVDDLELDWLKTLVHEVISSGKSWDSQGYESAIQLFDNGRERFFLPKAVPMNALEGVIGVTIILLDVTILRHTDELKSGLVSTVSHELRTPLTAMRMAIGLLHDTRIGTLLPRQQALAKSAHDECERLYQIIENLLNISRIESGRGHFDLQRRRAAPILHAAIDPFRERFAAKQLRYDTEIPENLPDVVVDEAFIGHALTNLLSNALKYTPSGGAVAVRATADEGMLTVCVSDTGPGIPAQFADQVFQKFFRARRADGPAGVGLGLSIAKEILEAHGGHIAYAPRSGGGCTFSFTLRSAD